MNTEQLTKSVGESVEQLFVEEVYLTGITEYGVSWEELAAGRASIPPQGARFDISFEGKLMGGALNGSVKGVDYLEIRGDGKFCLNLYATIITDDGCSIALKETGVLWPNPDRPADLHLNMEFSTAAEKYSWLNNRLVWGVSEVDMQKGIVHVTGYINK